MIMIFILLGYVTLFMAICFVLFYTVYIYVVVKQDQQGIKFLSFAEKKETLEK